MDVKALVVEAVAKYLAPRGLEWLESYSDEHKAELLSWVKEQVPGELFDSLAEEVVDDVIKHSLLIAKEYLKQLEAK